MLTDLLVNWLYEDIGHSLDLVYTRSCLGFYGNQASGTTLTYEYYQDLSLSPHISQNLF